MKLPRGERQRIALARVVLHKRRLSLLDEATSALHTDTERRLMNALWRVNARQTTIVSAYRLLKIRHATRILFIKEGRTV